MPLLEDFLHIRVGFISGADEVFIIPKAHVPDSEKDLYVPYLPDREMQLFTTPNDVESYFIYPYINGSLIEENILKKHYPKTWKHLTDHKQRLVSRGQVQKGNLDWWRPERPRLPQNMLIPKIISPHLTIAPRFSVDLEGKYAISRSPLMYPKEKSLGDGHFALFRRYS